MQILIAYLPLPWHFSQPSPRHKAQLGDQTEQQVQTAHFSLIAYTVLLQRMQRELRASHVTHFGTGWCWKSSHPPVTLQGSRLCPRSQQIKRVIIRQKSAGRDIKGRA